MMRIALVTTLVGLGVLGALGCQGSAPPPTPTPTVLPKLQISGPYIELTKDGPTPKELTVPVGITVTVVNRDTTYDRTTIRFETFTMEWVRQGESRTISFDRPGTYEYYMYTYPKITAKVIVTPP